MSRREKLCIFPIICSIFLLGISSLYAQGSCACQNYIPPCPPPDPTCTTWFNDGAWTSGQMDIPFVHDDVNCIVKVFFCGRNLTGTQCELPGYNVSCEYKITKVCFPAECAPECYEDQNSILQGLVNEIAKENPLGHVAAKVSEWNGPAPLKSAWKLSFPACFTCGINPITGCTEIQQCGTASCWKWYRAYKCDICPNADPPCTLPCPSASAIQLGYIPYSSGKDVGQCQQGTQCIMCGY